MNIICFGDSITQASEFAITNQWPALLHNKMDEWYPHTSIVYNKGIGTHTMALALDRFLEDVIPLLPGVLLVEFGINDSNVREWTRVPRVGIEEFKKNLTEFHRLCTKRTLCLHRKPSPGNRIGTAGEQTVPSDEPCSV